MKKIEKYLGFYTKEPFWACTKPNIFAIKDNANSFTEELSKVMLRSINKDFDLRICQDGLIIIQIKKLEKLREELKNKKEYTLEFNSEYLSYLNTFQFLLASETYYSQKFNYFRNKSLSTNDILRISGDKNHIMGIGWFEHNSINQLLLGRFLENYSTNKSIEKDFRIVSRGEINKPVLQKCISNFKKLFQDQDSFYLFSQINSAFSEFNNLNFRQTLILAWFCIEYFLNKDWILFLSKKKDSNKKIERIPRKRRDVLLGKDFTASVMSNILELNNILPHEILTKIDNVRSKRNNIVHNLDRIKKLSNILKENPENKPNQPIQLLDCLDCFDIMRYYVKKYYKLEIRFPVGFSYQQI